MSKTLWQDTSPTLGSLGPWGVARGPQLAAEVIPALRSRHDPELAHASDTDTLIRRHRQRRTT